ncbi:spore germination protein [Neobacillus niacini]|uniref:GerAB/ArcD/ProY family transporter n=1 Tax=Neobacillus niacini TaxID=86668 RepID=UPI0021CB65E7|nr:spore germination protein [Neobacillus niacini]MCM3767016.1 spore germination protein [Neobacillus niacini]
MKANYQPKPPLLVNAFMAFYIMHDLQVGVGINGFQRYIYMYAKHDSWVSVILVGLLVHLIVFLILKTLQLYGSTDIFGVHDDVFGKIIGKVFNAIFIVYCLYATLITLINYIEIVQSWIFPETPIWLFSLSLFLLMIYGITGGIRVIIGICFFNVIISLWVLFLLLFPLKYADFSQLLPVLDTNPLGIIKGTYRMTSTVLGFELFFVLYPHFKEKSKVQLYSHLGILISTIVYVAIMVISIAYFSPGQLVSNIWATLTMFRISKIPFIERFEYVTIAYWMIIILPNLMFYMWSAIRGMERSFKVVEKKSLLIFSILLFVVSLFFKTRLEISRLNQLFVPIGFYLAFCYPILLFFLAFIKRKWKSNKEQAL